jgi:hypothetical protein
MTPTFGLVMMAVCAAFFYHAGEEAFSTGIPLAAVSIGLWFVAGYLLAFGWLGCILVQVGLFAVLTARNVMRDKPKK